MPKYIVKDVELTPDGLIVKTDKGDIFLQFKSRFLLNKLKEAFVPKLPGE